MKAHSPAQPLTPLDKLKARQAQLDALVADGTLSPQTAQPARAELERQILAAVLGDAPATPGAAGAPAEAVAGPGVVTDEAAVRVRAPRALVLGTAAFVLVFAAAGYAAKGNLPGWSIGPGEGAAVAAEGADASPESPAQQAQIQGMVSQLEGKLKSKPDDAEGWRMLARSYGVLQRYPDAVTAHRRVVALLPKDALALADLADAVAMANNRSLDGEPEKLIAQAIKLDPDNPKALAMAGSVAFSRGDFKAAVANWEHAVKVADPASGYAQDLQGAVEEARKRAGLPPAAPALPGGGTVVGAAGAAAPAAPSAATAVSGRVSLKAGLKSQVGPDDTVFIFARAPSGSRMPLAILRKKASELPLDFTLDDSLAMSPAARLSSAAQVVVGARISKTGTAMPGPGDLEVLSATIAPGTQGLKLEIGEPVR
jgi:cytochrome c-type biogenesis protein CcmH